MEPAQLFEALRELATECGLVVKPIGAVTPGSETTTTSGTCRVRGELWVMLASTDPLEERIEILATALRSHAGRELEERYLPPALRERLDA